MALDSSIFIYQLESTIPFVFLTDIVFSLISQRKLTPSTSGITLAEILTKPFQDKNDYEIFLFRDVFERLVALRTIPIDNLIGPAAAFFRAKYGLRLPDAVQISAAIASGAETFVTNDKKLQQVKEIKILCLSDFV